MIPKYNLFQGRQPEFIKVIDTPNYAFRLYYDSDKHKTQLYPEMVCAVRRDSIVWFNLILKSGMIDSTNLSMNVHATFKSVPSLKNLGATINGFSFKIKTKTPTQVLSVLELSPDAPIGFYSVQLMNKSTPVTKKLSIFVVFNPFSPNDLVYVEKKEDIDDNIMREKLVIFSGTTECLSPLIYKLSQFSIEAVLTCIFYLNRMDMETRRDTELFTRLFTSYINCGVKKGLLEGSWNNEDFINGVHPLVWTDIVDIFRKFLETGDTVKYAQCFIFSSCGDSISRCLGMFSCSVSLFPCGHDYDGDGIITRNFITVDDQLLNEDSDMSWNYHCANRIGFRRQTQMFNPIEASRYFLQHVDATPQSISDGRYRCGPQPIELIRTQAYLQGLDVPYDAKVIYESINAIEHIVVRDRDRNIILDQSNGECCQHIYTCDKDFQPLDLIQDYRKLPVVSPLPPVHTILFKVKVPLKTLISDSINYQILISNTSEGLPTFMLLTAELTDDIGHLILDDPLLKNFQVFNQRSFSMQNMLVIPKIKSNVILLSAQICWNFKVYDDKLKQVESTQKFTKILPCFSGKIKNVIHVDSREAKISVSFKNELNFPLSNCRLVLEVCRQGGSIKVKNYVSCLPDSIIHHQFKLNITELGSVKIQLSIHCPYGRYVLDKRRIIHTKYVTLLTTQ